MTHVGRPRKRYVLFSIPPSVGEEFRDEVSRLVMGRHPEVKKNHIVWLDNGLIIRSTNTGVAGIEAEFSLAKGPGIQPWRVSGSISKLKRVAAGREG